MCSIAVFQVLVSEAMFFNVMHPTFEDGIAMLNLPGPIVMTSLAIFYALVYLYLRPVLKFIDRFNRGEAMDLDFAHGIQDRVTAFPYFMALLAYPFYMVGSTLATAYICMKLDWPYEVVRYGLLGGLISCLLTTPVAIYGYGWQVRPVLEASLKAVPGIEQARTAGQRITVTMKLVITVLSLVIAVTAYTLTVGYRQVNNLLENMSRMEQMLPEAGRQALVEKVVTTVDESAKSASFFRAQAGNLLGFYLAIMGICALVALALSLAAAFDLTVPLRVLRKAALRVRESRYGDPVRLISNDELSELAAVMNQMTETIRSHIASMEKVVAGLRDGVQQLDQTVHTIVSVSRQQENGATDQASALDQTSAIAKQIASTARAIEERARRMDAAAESTLGASRQGREKLEQSRGEFAGIMEQMDAIQGAMAQLEVRFRETYSIVEMLRDMAEKTEVLSLNASIEAASAGLEGKRFMVVAEETRNLSIKSGEAVRQIKELVTAIRQATVESIGVTEQGKARVSAGGKTIESAVATLAALSGFAESTFAAVKEITVSAEQQTKASEQLAGSVSEIYGVSREVEKGANEIHAAINNLQGFAESLRKTVSERAG